MSHQIPLIGLNDGRETTAGTAKAKRVTTREARRKPEGKGQGLTHAPACRVTRVGARRSAAKSRDFGELTGVEERLCAARVQTQRQCERQIERERSYR